ncbi:senescence-associated protein DIN1 isoform X2 [Citrus clementina]|uniref:senescence-associated protein DIN1 isoform X2 n=1 Tax=Citrus clementina TaxID=85681 RepID=UPI000CED2F54|nr:senescence-associated protein DIN1 isoform X2 [Citrus x clementina]
MSCFKLGTVTWMSELLKSSVLDMPLEPLMCLTWMTKNLKFVEEVSTRFRKHDEIIVGCQSGKRSMMAATDLLNAGFAGITDIAGGFAAWRQNGLPTEP